MTTQRPKVVIIGAGFGGIFAARKLADEEVDVLIIDRNNFHTFTPLIYQVATCGLDMEEVAYPVRGIFRKHDNIEFMLGDVLDIDSDASEVHVKVNGHVRQEAYDYLIVAAGSEANYFGNDEIKQRSFSLKDLKDAVTLRNHILKLFERADWVEDEEYRDALTTLVVVGGGPTGLEMAGALHELYTHVLRQEYTHLKDIPARVILVEATDTVLRPYPESLQKSAVKQLRSIGVEVMLGKMVDKVGDGFIKLSDGETIPTYTLVWATGVKASSLAEKLDVELARGGRIPVEPTMQLTERDNIYAVGDIAYLENPDGQPYPQLIPVAQQQATLAGKNILSRIQGKAEKGFKYFDRGSMATIGRVRAVAWIFNRIQLSGYLAWLAWLGLHLMTLLGFRNRLNVFINWVWNYVTYDRSARVIMEYSPEEEVAMSMPYNTPFPENGDLREFEELERSQAS